MKKKILILTLAVLAVSALALSAFSFARAAGPGFPAGSAGGPSPIFAHPHNERGDGPLRPYIEEASAEILGIPVEALRESLDDGTKMDELLETAGLTHLEFRQALDAATPGIVRAALADEAISDELAERILEFGLPYCHWRHDRRGPGGPGGNGPFGQNG
ncbi:MAG TPA: hypothetical protein VMN57_15165 [Anaerolineales bacterium]|nr:hypothetical protein [Anaerolineales bacterium]